MILQNPNDRSVGSCDTIESSGDTTDQHQNLSSCFTDIIHKQMNKASYYLDPKAFSNDIRDYNLMCKDRQEKGLTTPKIPDTIGLQLLTLSTNMAKRREFSGYTYKEDMIQEGVISCLKCIKNFDHTLGYSAFSYFSQVVYFRFVQIIKKENKQSMIKGKILENYHFDDFILDGENGDTSAISQQLEHNVITNNYFNKS
jgi:hypothetical protein